MQSSSPVLMERLIAGIALAIVFVLLGSVFVPKSSDAHHDDHHDAAHGDAGHGQGHGHDLAHSTDPHEGLSSLGWLESRGYMVQIFGTGRGPHYSIYDAASGEELAVLITAERAAQRFPDLPLPDMEFDEPKTLMLHEPGKQDWSRDY